MTLATLLERIRPSAPAASTSAMPLATALEELEIEPFDRASVDRYKVAMKNAAMRNLLPGASLASLADHAGIHAYTQGRVFLWEEFDPAVLPPNTFYANEVANYKREGWDVKLFHERRYGLTYLAYVRWKRYSLTDGSLHANVLRRTLPDFVARKADQIEARIPGVEIEIDKLESRSQDCDPFLIVRSGHEEHYVEVWGESFSV